MNTAINTPIRFAMIESVRNPSATSKGGYSNVVDLPGIEAADESIPV